MKFIKSNISRITASILGFLKGNPFEIMFFIGLFAGSGGVFHEYGPGMAGIVGGGVLVSFSVFMTVLEVKQVKQE